MVVSVVDVAVVVAAIGDVIVVAVLVVVVVVVVVFVIVDVVVVVVVGSGASFFVGLVRVLLLSDLVYSSRLLSLLIRSLTLTITMT